MEYDKSSNLGVIQANCEVMDMRFKDRKAAGIQLADALLKYQGEAVVVFALPRGGVVLGAEIARQLHAPLGLLITKKIGHPRDSEYAIGAVTESGEPIYDPEALRQVDPAYLTAEAARMREEIKRRRQTYLGDAVRQAVAGKIVILVDDGIATGLTMMAAIQEISQLSPERIVLAIPVIPSDIAGILKTMVDELVALKIDDYFLGSVGSYYEDFHQVEDHEVIALIKSVNGP